MRRQEFHTTDLVRLEVQDGWPDLPNLIDNPSGSGGAWGWYAVRAAVVAASTLGASSLTMTVAPGLSSPGTTNWAVDVAEVTAVDSRYVKARLSMLRYDAPGVGGSWKLQVYARDAANVSTLLVSDDATSGAAEVAATAVPVGTVRLLFTLSGDNKSAAPIEYAFRSAIMVFGDAADVAATDFLAEPPWTNVLGSTQQIDIERDELDAGVLTATIYDSTLDPASFDLIRPGKRCRCHVLVGGVWEPIFTGLLANPSTVYLVKDPKIPALKRARIQLVANDPAAQLAAAPRPNGVGTIAELPVVLVGTGVPWNLNGSTVPTDPDDAVVVAVNDSASALDQVAITRDSVQGYAWIDRTGTVQVWDAALIPTTVALEVDELDYSDLDTDFDLGRLINSVIVRLSRINPGTGDTEEVEYGPYENPASLREWRTRRAEFRIQGVDDADVPAFAAAVLAANSVPAKRINEVVLPLRTVADVEAKALTDLYDLVQSSNDRAGILGQQARVTSVKQSIVADAKTGGRWSMTLGFSTEGSVATPQVTPAPGTGGKTMAQLLRPVGEVTQWLGAKADIPAGWLPLDGSTFDGDAFPDLATLLGGTTLPDFTDRFPIGAGTKALATVGGSPTAAVPAHTHTIPAHNHTVGAPDGTVYRDPTGSGADNAAGTAHTHPVTGGGGGATSGPTGAAFDVLNPWLSLWFIIRAV